MCNLFIIRESLALRHTELHYNILIERRSLWYASRLRASTSFTCTSSLDRTEQNFIRNSFSDHSQVLYEKSKYIKSCNMATYMI